MDGKRPAVRLEFLHGVHRWRQTAGHVSIVRLRQQAVQRQAWTPLRKQMFDPDTSARKSAANWSMDKFASPPIEIAIRVEVFVLAKEDHAHRAEHAIAYLSVR